MSSDPTASGLRTSGLGRDALANVRLAEARMEVERIRLHRAYLCAWVSGVSPLVLDLAELNGVDLAAALGAATPPPGWPKRSGRHVLAGARADRRVSLRMIGVFGHYGRPRELDGATVAGTALAVASGVLVTCGRIGDWFCVGRDDAIELYVPGLGSEALRMACVDRRLAQVVGHPAFDMRPYRVVAAESVDDEVSVLVAEASALPFAWPVEL